MTMAKTKMNPTSEGVVFNLKPQLTLAMKLAATFAITYYGLLLIYEIFALSFSRFFFDAYYFDESASSGSLDFVILIGEVIITGLLVFSLIRIFLKRPYGKIIFIFATVVLIIFQLITTGVVTWQGSWGDIFANTLEATWYKYVLEILLVLIIAPIRVKKKLKIKQGKIALEEVKETKNGEESEGEGRQQPS